MPSLRIALAQTCPTVAEIGFPTISDNLFEVLERNLLDVTEWVKKASEGGADIVVFPEYFLQGLVDEGRQYLALPSQHLLSYLSELARKYNVSIVGTIVHAICEDLPQSSPFDHLLSSTNRDITVWKDFLRSHPITNHSPKLHNTAFYIEAGTGAILDQYAKRNLWHPERLYLTPGKAGHQVFETRWGRCAFLICWDVSHPGSGQVLSDLGVDIVFAPTYWIGYDSAPMIHKHNCNPPRYEAELLSALSYTRAFETETVWVLCNAGGPADEGYIGCSGVWMPLKGKLGGCEGTESSLAIVEVDLDVLKDARSFYRVKADNDERSLS